ncbi:FimV/HubP family polar landmark protein [Polynucleobacter sp. CS-Odin-A6]|uniref:FimV/HubP family polar landmark protein n=1 Tax=Polynucleobacter sp. CS-Odin-A6 TaxID=2689106 RepID=UPI002105DD0E|nr:FimV/HubP family polar landmark protein [Polynucleobacter sp. CS-Odin-A6]
MKLVKVKALCLIWLSWSCTAGAISLGSPKLLSRPGEPLKVEFPIRVGAEEQSLISSLNVDISNKAVYEKRGVSQKLLMFNPQAMVYRNQKERLMVLVETVESVPAVDDPFLDVMVTLNWSAGSITKTYTLLLGDPQKITVRPGQSLSEIASQLLPKLDGATLDQTMMALFRANPDAFASGSINRLEAGAELSKPSQALLRSISPAEAYEFVAESNAQWQSKRASQGGASTAANTSKSGVALPAQDRLKIGSTAEGNSEERRYTEELVAQEKILEQSRERVVELEKNIADLQQLLDKAKGKDKGEPNSNNASILGSFAPAILALVLMGFTGLLLWLLAKNARKSEARHFSKEPAQTIPTPDDHAASPGAMPNRAKALFAGIDLDLSPAKKTSAAVLTESNPLADTLRVKLNLARAYITIEDFAAAKKSLQEIILIGADIDTAITVEAQGMLAELSDRHH